MNKSLKFLKWVKIICLIIVLCAGTISAVRALEAESNYLKEEDSNYDDVELSTSVPYVLNDGSNKLKAEVEMYKWWCATLSCIVLFWMIIPIDRDVELHIL